MKPLTQCEPKGVGLGGVTGRTLPFGPGSGPRLFRAIVAGLGGLLAAALFLLVFDGGLPKPPRAEAAVAAPSGPGLCMHGAGGELLDFAPAGRHCQ